MFNAKNKAVISFLILTVIIVYSIPLQAKIIPLEGLKKAEMKLHGNISEAAILEKINSLELEIFGHKTKGSLADRAQGIIDYIFLADKGPSLVLLLPYMEWTLYNQVKEGSLVSRIENIEISIYGEIKEGAIVTRMEKLVSLLVPIDDDTLFKKVAVEEGLEIHIKTEEEINTANLEAGKSIKFVIPGDVKVDGYLIIPGGTTGTLKVTKFNKAGNFGKDAELKIGVNDIKTLDGNILSLNLKSSDKDANSQEIAVGVSLLSTIIISNPVGLVAGYFLKGKDIVIPEGTFIRTQIVGNKEVYGFRVQK